MMLDHILAFLLGLVGGGAILYAYVHIFNSFKASGPPLSEQPLWKSETRTETTGPVEFAEKVHQLTNEEAPEPVAQQLMVSIHIKDDASYRVHEIDNAEDVAYDNGFVVVQTKDWQIYGYSHESVVKFFTWYKNIKGDEGYDG